MSSHQNGHPKLEIMQCLVCSTAHVTQEEAQQFEHRGEAPNGHLLWTCEYGWMFYIGRRTANSAEDWRDVSEGLRAVVEKAWEYALDWVRFDRDGDVIEGLPTYDW